MDRGGAGKRARLLEPFHFETALTTRRCGPPQRGVDSAKNDVFWQNANVDFCKKSTFICPRGPSRGPDVRKVLSGLLFPLPCDAFEALWLPLSSSL